MYRIVNLEKDRRIIKMLDEGYTYEEIQSVCKTSPNRIGAIKNILANYVGNIPMYSLPDEDLIFVLERPLGVGKNRVPGLKELQMLCDIGTIKKDLWIVYKNFCKAHDLKVKSLGRFRELLSRNRQNFEERKPKNVGKVVLVHLEYEEHVSNKQSGEPYGAVFTAFFPYSGYMLKFNYENVEIKSWIKGHIQLFNYLAGVPCVVVPFLMEKSPLFKDNDSKNEYERFAESYQFSTADSAAVKKFSSAYERTDLEFASKFDSSKLFDDIAAADGAMIEYADNRSLFNSPYNVRDIFLQVDQKNLRKIPKNNYEYVDVKKDIRVAYDSHVVVSGKKYSIPFEYIGKQVEAHIGEDEIRFYIDYKLIAKHKRIIENSKQRFSTVPEHMPPRNMKGLKWNYSKIIRWAGNIGPNTERVIQNRLDSYKIEQQAYDGCLAILSLANKYEGVEEVCAGFRDSIPAVEEIRARLHCN